MKKIKMFILRGCPYCRQALEWQKELTDSDKRFSALDIELIDEREQPEIAESFDYYYVPTYYVDGQKLHEGAATKEKIESVLLLALQ